MANSYWVEPDVKFVKQLMGLGGETLKKCYQCATCSVVCPISPDEKPFPRKEMIAAQWGLKDKLVGNMDVWLCHHCNDCSTYCPRGARPGDVLNAVRAYSIQEYAWPKWLGKIVPDGRFWWLLLAIPVAIFLFVLGVTGHLHIPEGEIEFAHFFPTLLVDLIFVPLAMVWIPLTFGIGIYRFMTDIHKNALAEGKTKRKDLNIPDFLKSIACALPTILSHNKFSQCSENKGRYLSHILVFFSFLGLFVVTNIFFVALYILQIPGPYSMVNPVKILANVSGIALLVGAILMISNRLKDTDANVSKGSYFDWSLIILVLGLAVTGLLSQYIRLANVAVIAYPMYFAHLVLVFCLFTYLPFSKLAHMVYRTLAMAYSRYSEREPCE
ncbi:MAG: quinone-interacting membrane-bound oxidoreductase complex subunit QmoC [Deltaproteobacteria bacterium]|nr:quinone-interacting membrane-bound oxidoreductase complex subunit QmoC [Deltaproteobacteria bacterium]MBW1793135.1 quinone-interacting membrane-bound oxidoreductase complex subunit QmoC [Deltaproteobacteria bacterium]